MLPWRVMAALASLVAAPAVDLASAPVAGPASAELWRVVLEPEKGAELDPTHTTFDLRAIDIVAAPIDGENATYVFAIAAAPGGVKPRDDTRAPVGPSRAAPPEGFSRPLGALRPLRDLLELLLRLLRAAGLLALYHRIVPARVLDHPLRAALIASLRASPGRHVASLAEELGVDPKTLAHHARVLRRAGFVHLEREGRILRLHLIGEPSRALPEASLTRARALDLLRAERGLDRGALARACGVTPQAMSYHLKILVRQGRVRARFAGRRREYELA